MGLYRICHNLHLKGEILRPGAVHRLEGLAERSRARLLARGAIRPVVGPPLSELPGWGERSRRAARLAAAGVTGATDLLDADPDATAAALGIGAALVRRWQAEVETLLTASPPPGGGA